VGREIRRKLHSHRLVEVKNARDVVDNARKFRVWAVHFIMIMNNAENLSGYVER